MRDTLDRLQEQHNKRLNYHTHYRSTKVRCIDSDGNERIFNSIKEAHEVTGVAISGISCVCSGINHRSGGYRWEYVED